MAVQFQGDTPSVVGSGLDEMFRHVPALKADGIEVILNIFRTLIKLGDHADEATSKQEVLLAILDLNAPKP
jgi:hypothetical protein